MDDLTNDEIEQLMSVFRDQSLLILEEMNQDLIALESAGVDADALARLRRAAHTIKGDAACIGLEGVTELAHRVEDIFDLAAKSEGGFDSSLIDLILESLELIRDSVAGGVVRDVEKTALDGLLGRMDGLAGEDSDAAGGRGRAVEMLTVNEADRASSEKAMKARREYLRVDAEKVDALLNLAAEMVIARSAIGQIEPELSGAFANSDLYGRFAGANMQMGKLIAELQKSALRMRMVTMDQVFKRFARPMRELASNCGKAVELDLQGGDTRLDRALVDLLYEPLLHLLRNAIDHGLETEEERAALEKPVAGKIAVRAYHDGNQIVVEVSDDGRGIDVAGIKRKAVDMGAVSALECEQMSDDDALQLIFLQGLSTAREVTKLSGRGVGTSTVRSAVEGFRGSVSVKSVLGKGTTFVLRMPLTLAIIRAILFSASGQLFALPLPAIREIARAEWSDVVRVNGIESYRLRDRFISLVRPGAVLNFDRRRGGSGAVLRRGDRRLFVIVLATGDRRYAVVADELFGEQELVIRSLESEWIKNDAIAGGSVLGDGRVVLIMDAGMMFRKAVKYERKLGEIA